MSNMYSPENILTTVKQIKEEYDSLSPTDETKKTLMDKYPDFSAQYPALFQLVFNPVDNWEKDLERLTQMVALASKVKTNKITQHDASVQIGTELVDKYVKPKLKNN